MNAILPGPITPELAQMLTELFGSFGSSGVPLPSSQGGLWTSNEFDDNIMNIPFWAKLTSVSGGYYAWTEQQPLSPKGYTNLPGGRSGTTAIQPAYEANGNAAVVPSVVLLQRAYFDVTLGWVYSFVVGTAGTPTTAFYGAYIDDNAGATNVPNNVLTTTPIPMATVVSDPFGFYSASSPSLLTVPTGGDGYYVAVGTATVGGTLGGTFSLMLTPFNSQILAQTSLVNVAEDDTTSPYDSYFSVASPVIFMIAGFFVQLSGQWFVTGTGYAVNVRQASLSLYRVGT